MGDSIEHKRAELAAIVAEIEADAAQRVLREPAVRQHQDERRLRLERELAQADGAEYAEPIEISFILGDEWHVLSKFGHDTVVITGDVGGSASGLVRFNRTEAFQVSGPSEDVDASAMKGLDLYGLFVVRNSEWKRSTLAAASSEKHVQDWLSRLDEFVLRSKGGQLRCLANDYEHRSLPVPITSIRDGIAFWERLEAPSES